jgi:hypothetical protein
MFNIDLVILTKSAKKKGYCVAGIDLNTHDWVRLISSNDECDGALSDSEMRSRGGYTFQPLDVVRVTISEQAPIGCQTENYIVAYGYPWQSLGKMNFQDVLRICSVVKSQYIFGNKYKYITSETINAFNRSLLLTEVTDLHIFKNEMNKQKCNFRYNGNNYYELSVTDPDYYKYTDCEIKRAYIVVSLPHTDYEGKYYKFVAKIFPETQIVDKNPLSSLSSLF